MFSIQTSSGKSIKEHSYFQQEDEILLPPGRYFEVVDKMSPGGGLHIIVLREVSPPFKMLADPFDLSQLKEVLPPSKPEITPQAITKSSKPEVSKQVISKSRKFTSFHKE